MTSAERGFASSREANMVEKASAVEAGGTGEVTERGLWREKKDATWTSGQQSVVVTPQRFFTGLNTMSMQVLRRRNAGQ